MRFYQQIRSVKKSKLTEFRDDIIFINEVMTSQIIQHDVKIWWRRISVKNVIVIGIALKPCRLFDPAVAIFAVFHKVDRDLQKYRHLQMSFTHGVIGVSLRRNITDMVLKILPFKFQRHYK